MTHAIAETVNETKIELAAEILRSGGRVQMRALGASMLPSLCPGDLLTIEAVRAEALSPGEIVLVYRNGRFFIHRLVRCGSSPGTGDWFTRGDALTVSDPAVPSNDILGRVCGVRRGERLLLPRRKPSWPMRVFAWMLGRSDALRNLTLRWHAVRQEFHAPKSKFSFQVDFAAIYGLAIPSKK